MPIKIIRSVELAKEVTAKWRKQYFSDNDKSWSPQKFGIYENLLALPELTPQAVNAVIGNESWTSVSCDNCSGCDAYGEVIQVGQAPDWESNTVDLCPKCFKEAIKLALESGFITLD